MSDKFIHKKGRTGIITITHTITNHLFGERSNKTMILNEHEENPNTDDFVYT